VRSLVALLVGGCLAASAVAAASAPPDAAQRFLAARLLADEGRLEEALAALDEARAAVGEDPYLELERAQLLARAGRLDEASEAIDRARRLAPGEAEIHRQQGRIEMSRLEDDGRAAEVAKSAFEALRSLAPDDLEALVSLGQLYLASGQAALAVEVLEEAQRQRPDHPWIQALRARALAATGEPGADERIHREALARDPGDLRARFELAARWARDGRHASAAELLAAAPERQRADPELRFRLARQLFLAGDAEAAHELAGELVRERPEAAPARLLAARSAIALGYFAEAESTLAPLAGRAADDALIAELLLRAFEGQQRWREAAELLAARREALRRSGESEASERTALALARMHGELGEWARAAELAREVAGSADAELRAEALRQEARSLAVDAGLDRALSRLAESPGETADLLRLELLLSSERRTEALALAAELGAREGLELQVAGLLQDAGLHESAIERLAALRAARPESLAVAFRYAACLERLGRREEAVAEFRRLLERERSSAATLNYLGYLWIERGENLEEALAMVSEAVRIDPDNGAYVDSLGWGLFQLGRVAEAVRALERAARLLPHDATVLEHLGDARAAAGDSVGAREAYGRALAAGPESAEAVERKRARLSGDS
jgi:predicted Zn-dependent protease